MYGILFLKALRFRYTNSYSGLQRAFVNLFPERWSIVALSLTSSFFGTAFWFGSGTIYPALLGISMLCIAFIYLLYLKGLLALILTILLPVRQFKGTGWSERQGELVYSEHLKMVIPAINHVAFLPLLVPIENYCSHLG